MKIPFLKRKISAGVLLFLATNMAQAGITFFSFVPLIFLNLFTTVTTTTPFFTFIPVMLTGSKPTTFHPSIRYPQTTLLKNTRKLGIQRIVRLTPITTPNIVVPQNDRKIIKYRVTNFSTKPTKLRLKPVRGIKQIVNAGSCPNLFSLRYRQSCILNLQVNGTMLANNIVGGPVLCESGSIRCYQPNHGHRLNVKLIKKIPTVVRKYTVGGTIIGLTNGTLTLVLNGNTPISIPRNGRFTFSTPIAQGKSYRVNIKTHPQHQICKITNNAGTMNRTGITNVLVSCIEEREDVAINLANSASDEAVKSSSSTPSLKTSDELTKNNKANPYKNDLADYPLSLTDTTADNIEPALSEDRPSMPVNSDNSILIQQTNAQNITDEDKITTESPANDLDSASYDDNEPGLAAMRLVQNKVNAELSAEEPSDSVSVFSTNPLAESPTNTHLAASINNLALSVTGHTEYGVMGTPLSGAARIITIKNLGEVEAEHLMITTPTWPLNTVSTTTCGSSLAPGAHCIITVIPGPVASSDGTHPCSNGTNPIPEVIQVSADNAEPISINTVILNYGCIYQGGYVYAFDDTTPNTKSVGGKVVALIDQNSQNSGISWNPQAQNVDIENDWTLIDPSNPSLENSSDDDFILVNHEQTEDAAPTNQAAQHCHQSFSGYDNWYLPTICEMGYGSDLCGNEGAPVLQNMQSNLVDFNNLNLLMGNYWSSTEVLSYPYDYAWRQNFAPSGDSSQFPIHKNEPLKVRCARALTN